MITWLGGTFIQWLCSIAVTLPFFAAALQGSAKCKCRVNWRHPVLLSIFFFVSLALTRLEPLGPFQTRLWQAMLLEAAWALIFIGATQISKRASLTWKISPEAWKATLLATVLLVLFVATRSLALRITGLGHSEETSFGIGFLIYQATMPGLAEELGYRGVVQPGLNQMFGRPWILLQAPVGWGWIITSVVFWAPHAFRVDEQLQLSFYWPTLTMQLVVGFVLGWLRERTGSLLPPIIAHNLVNVVWTLT